MVHFILMDAISRSGHALDHVAVRYTEAGVVFEKIAVREHVSDDELVLDQRIAFKKESVAGV
jgi:hypothetical protein